MSACASFVRAKRQSKAPRKFSEPSLSQLTSILVSKQSLVETKRFYRNVSVETDLNNRRRERKKVDLMKFNLAMGTFRLLFFGGRRRRSVKTRPRRCLLLIPCQFFTTFLSFEKINHRRRSLRTARFPVHIHSNYFISLSLYFFFA